MKKIIIASLLIIVIGWALLHQGNFTQETVMQFGVALTFGAICVSMFLFEEASDHPLRSFIKESLALGHTAAAIKYALVMCGWHDSHVKEGFAAAGVEMPSVDTPGDHTALLHSYVQYHLEQGLSLLLIKDQMLEAGWSLEVIEPILKAKYASSQRSLTDAPLG